MTPYSFALVRYVHNAAAQEFANIGVVMWLPDERRLLYRLHEKYARLSGFFPEFDGAGFRQTLRMLRSRLEDLKGSIEARQASFLEPHPGELSEMLKRALGLDATCFSWSHTMGGVVTDPQQRFERLMYEFVERHDLSVPRQRRDESEIWTGVEERFRQRGLLGRLRYGVELEGGNYSYCFRTAWRNGVAQVMEPVSFDYLNAGELVDKAATWSGRLFNLAKGAPFQFTGVVAPPDREDLMDAYGRAIQILGGAPNVRRLVRFDEVDAFLPEIERDLAQHPEDEGS